MSASKTARTVGILFIAGTAAGILSLPLAAGHLHAPDYLVRLAENSTSVLWGGILTLIMGISLSMIPVVLFPSFRKSHEPLALGAVVFRGALEMTAYMAIVTGWFLLLTLSQKSGGTGGDEAVFIGMAGELLTDFGKKAAFLLDLVFSIGALFIYTLFIRTRLIPFWLSFWGLAGGVLYLAYPVLSLFGLSLELLQAPLGIQEMVLAGWLLIRGFNPDAWEALNGTRE